MSLTRTDIQSQTKHTIYNVYNYFKKLSTDMSNQAVAVFFGQAQRRTADACGVSLKSVQRIVAEGKKSTSSDGNPTFTTPRLTYKRSITSFDVDVVRAIIDEYRDNHGDTCPAPKTILTAYQQKMGYAGSLKSMRRILKSLQFKTKLTNRPKRARLVPQSLHKCQVDSCSHDTEDVIDLT